MRSTHRLYLYKRTNGRYYIGYKDGAKIRWKSTGESTKSEALRALARFQRRFSVTSESVSLSEFVTRFLTFAETSYSRKTLEIYQRVLLRFAASAGDKPLMAVTAEHFDQYKAERLKRVQPVSANIELRALRATFSTAKRWRLIESNPFSEVKLASVPERTPLFLTIQDAKQLLACIPEGWLREVVLFALLTGMRRGEVLNLKWENVDFTRRLVHIETSPSFKTKQGRRRTIPLNAKALYLVRSRQGKSSCEHVFSLNDRPIYGNWVQHLFKRYVRRAGLDERVHFHSLRHTFASWLVQNGASLYEIQKLLGHSGPQVTQIYAHLSPSELHGTVDKIVIP